MIWNMYAPNNRAPKYIKQYLIKLWREVHRSLVILEEFNTLLLAIARITEQIISKDIEESTNSMQLTYIE